MKERQVRRARKKKKKGIEALRTKHSTTSRAIDALTGEEKQNGKQRREVAWERKQASESERGSEKAPSADIEDLSS